jgi:DNA-binding GntR family transcriptional regulator
MPPGSEFTEGELVREFELSKTPIREALARLRQDDLVEAVSRSGYRVTPVTVKDARDLMSVRILLEGEAAALAAVRSGATRELRELESLCKSSYDPSDRSSIVAFLDANHRFHLAVARMSGNHRLLASLTHVLEQLERVMHLGLSASSRADEIVHEHEELLGALMAGDSARARAVAVAQGRAAQHMVLNALLTSDTIMDTNLGGPHTRP